jgi:hypothetical protein
LIGFETLFFQFLVQSFKSTRFMKASPRTTRRSGAAGPFFSTGILSGSARMVRILPVISSPISHPLA